MTKKRRTTSDPTLHHSFAVKLGWFWQYDDLQAGPYRTLEDIALDLDFEVPLVRKNYQKWLLAADAANYRITWKRDRPIGMLEPLKAGYVIHA